MPAAADRFITDKIALPPLRVLRANGLALTPPMGWSSWNHFAVNIDERVIRDVADAMVTNGLRDAGYTYVNIDDGWQGRRDVHGELHSNSKFPDMKALADYLHSKGLRLGIYSSPAPVSCAGYAGSHGHETEDAATFARWGVDFLKYDWCSAGEIYTTRAEMQALYQTMGAALQATGRPIVYSLCQYGLFDVGRWGRKVGANLWRTSGDISDSWAGMSNNGFEEHGDRARSGPGGWNDPDMLEIGNGGMSLVEYRTHMTLWSMLAAPLILGNDIRAMTSDVRAILSNKEVIAVDQDPVGRSGQPVAHFGSTELWLKPLSDRSTAVALFNRADTPSTMDIRWFSLGLRRVMRVRDLWSQTDLGSLESYRADVPAHGSVLLKAAEEP
jgi:alpha-galactosidase